MRELLRDGAGAGTVLLGESDPMTVESVLQTWSSVTGERSRLAPVDTEEFIRMVNEKMPCFGEEFADNGDESVKRPADLGIEGGRLLSYRQYLEGLDREALGVVMEK